jgi:drug/metabolite transporter (DMT)-like permease
MCYFVWGYFRRLEQVNTRRLHSMAKIFGTLVAVGGAMFLTLFKGSVLNLPWTNGRNHHDHQSAVPAHKQDVFKGALLVFGSSFFWSCFMILHVSFSIQCFLVISQNGLSRKLISLQIKLRITLRDGPSPLTLVEAFPFPPCLRLLILLGV